jgi:hypothetical protein
MDAGAPDPHQPQAGLAADPRRPGEESPGAGGFRAESDARMGRVMEMITSATKPADIRRYSDMYKHLIKLQMVALQNPGRPEHEESFSTHYLACFPEDGAWVDGEDPTAGGGDGPTPSQIQELQRSAKTYCEMDSRERELRARVSEIRSVKSKLSENVMRFMRRYGVDDLEVGDQGKIVYRTRTVKKKPTREQVRDRILSFFPDDPATAERLVALVSEEAEAVERESIRMAPVSSGSARDHRAAISRIAGG